MLDLSQKQVLTFDCYGTLIDWESGLLAAFQPVLRAHGLNLEDETVLQVYAEFEAAAERGPYQTYRDIIAGCLRGIGGRYGFTPAAAELAAVSGSVGEWPAFPDSAEALAQLKTRYRLAILSNIDDDLFALSNRRLGVTFDALITAQQVRGYKPGHAHFHAALERLGVPREKILHVAQSLFHDHVPAKQLGWDTVWVNRRHGRPGSGATPPAEAKPDLEFPDMRSVAQALV